MDDSRARASRLPAGAILVGLAGYALTQELSFAFPDVNRIVMAIWPASGVAIAVFLLLGRRSWPALALGLWVVGSAVNLLNGRSPVVSLGFAAIEVFETWLCSAFLARGLRRVPFGLGRVDGILALAVSAIFVNALPAFLAGLLALAAHGADPWSAWFMWWVSDGLGQLLILPLILAFAGAAPQPERPSLLRSLESVAAFALALGLTWVSFRGMDVHPHVQPYFLLPLVAWPALRASARGLSASLLGIAVVAILGEAVSKGPSPLFGETQQERLLFVEAFIAVITISAWILFASFAERAEARRKAEERLARNERLLAELYHRANNNMQMISSLLDLERERREGKDESRGERIDAMQGRILALGLVNRRLFQSSDLSYVDMHAYVAELLGAIGGNWPDSAPRIGVELELSDLSILVDAAVPCGLILNELITNVYRHAYPAGRGGPLRIELGRDPKGLIRIRVADRGRGLPEGFDPARDGGSGMRIVSLLCAEQLRGSLSYDRSGGLACELLFAEGKGDVRI